MVSPIEPAHRHGRLGAERMIDQHRVPVPLGEHVGSVRRLDACVTRGAPARQPPLQQRGLDRSRARRSASPRRRASGGANAGLAAGRARQRHDRRGRSSPRRARSPPRCGRPCARRCAGRSRARGRCRRTCAPTPPSACSNSWKMRACCSGAMPMPVSRTSNTISSGRPPASTMTPTPPVSVNLMALPARLSSTWRSRVASPMTRSGSRSSTSEAISRPLAWARGASSSTTSSTSAASENGCGSSSSLPASILEKSRISSISDSSASPEALVALT